jgi:hypoxanthine phosphoribosyltransferase
MKQHKQQMLLSHHLIQDRLVELASDINSLVTTNPDFEDAVCVPILQGAVPFFVELTSYLCWNPVVDYVGIRTYEGTSRSTIDAYKMPKHDYVNGKCVFLFDDILESGNTVEFFTKTLYSMGAKEVVQVALLKKKTSTYQPDPRVSKVLVGFEIDDLWVYGYGMDDENGKGRSLKHVLYNEPISKDSI